MNKAIRFIDELNDEELLEFTKDLKNGTIDKLIEQKREYFKIKEKKCSVCENNINEDCLVVIYGDPRIGIRKKAHFCGTDCMEYFTNNNIRNKSCHSKNTEKKKNNNNTNKIIR